MKMLAIDTSTDYLTLAAMDGEKTLGRFHRKADRNHSSLLIPMIDQLLKKSKLRLKDIDIFCVGIGPGSFTGLRIGVVTVKGMGYSLNKPVIAVPSLDAIARNVKNFCGIICPVLDAKKSKVYACFYRSDKNAFKRVSEYLLLPVKDLMREADRYEKVIFLGDGVGLIGKEQNANIDWHPKADIIGMIGLELAAKKRFTTPQDLEPLYLYSRECDITGQ